MNKDNYDAETQIAVSEAEALEAMFGSSGWKVAERELDALVAELRDIRTVPRDGDVVLNLEIRDKTANVLEEWRDSLKSQVNNVTILKEDKGKSKTIERR